VLIRFEAFIPHFPRPSTFNIALGTMNGLERPPVWWALGQGPRILTATSKMTFSIKAISDYGGRNNFRGFVISNLNFRLLYPLGQNRLYSLKSRLGGPRSRSGRKKRERCLSWWNGRKMKRDVLISVSSIEHCTWRRLSMDISQLTCVLWFPPRYRWDLISLLYR